MQSRTADRLQLSVVGLGTIVAPAPADARVGQRGAFAIRPEQVCIGAPTDHAGLGNRLAGTLREFLYVGDVTTYKMELANGTRIQALLPNAARGTARLAVGDPVSVAWPDEAGLFLHE